MLMDRLGWGVTTGLLALLMLSFSELQLQPTAVYASSLIGASAGAACGPWVMQIFTLL